MSPAGWRDPGRHILFPFVSVSASLSGRADSEDKLQTMSRRPSEECLAGPFTTDDCPFLLFLPGSPKTGGQRSCPRPWVFLAENAQVRSTPGHENQADAGEELLRPLSLLVLSSIDNRVSCLGPDPAGVTQSLAGPETP